MAHDPFLDDDFSDPFLTALQARATSSRTRAQPAPVRLAHPAMLVTLPQGEVVELPALPALDRDDAQAWKDHVRHLLATTFRQPEDHWRHRLDRDAAEPLLAMDDGHRPGMGAMDKLMQAGVSANPSAGRSMYVSIGMQEALMGLTLALGMPVGKDDFRRVAQHGTHPHLLQRLLDAVTDRPAWFGPSPLPQATDVLHLATKNRNPEAPAIVDRLVAHGAVLDHTNHDGQSALGEAVAWGNIDVLQSLLRNGVPVDLCRDYAKPPVVNAIVANRGDLVTPLIAAGAATVHREAPNNPEQHYALTTLAIKHVADRALEALIDAGLDPLMPDTHLQAHRTTPLALAHLGVQQWIGTPREAQAQRCLEQLERLELRRTLAQEPAAATAADRPRPRL